MPTAEEAYEAVCDEHCELALPRVLEGIAQGSTRGETYTWVASHYPVIRPKDLNELLDEALDDAQACGIERDDIDDSWFGIQTIANAEDHGGVCQCTSVHWRKDCPDHGEKLNLTAFDFTVQDEGTIVILHPENDAARDWIDENLYLCDGTGPQWWGGGVVIEHRCFDDIQFGIAADGLTIQ